MRIDNVKLDEAYFDWLYFKVVPPHDHHPSNNYRYLLLHLYKTPFNIVVPNDENRAEDGATLRDVFVTEKNVPVDEDDEDWFAMDCSIFELVVGVAERMAFECDRSVRNCFWELLGNLELSGFNDAWYSRWARDKVDSTLYIFNERLYHPSGSGGLFPLRNPQEDQTTVEIWYQMAAYLDENSSID